MTDDKRQAILDAALLLFSDFGFHATSVPAVAQSAFVSTGTMYRHFPSKEALVNELYRLWKGRLGEALLTDFPADGSPRAQFHHFWSRAARFAQAHPKAIRFLELHHHGAYLDEQSKLAEEYVFAPAIAALERAAREELVKPLPPHLLMAIVWGAFLGVIKTIWDGRLPAAPDTLRDAEQCAWEAIRR